MLAMLSLLGSIGRRHQREEIRPYVDGLTDAELGEVYAARAAARLAEDGVGDLLDESAAARLRGVDVARHGSRPESQPSMKKQGRR